MLQWNTLHKALWTNAMRFQLTYTMYGEHSDCDSTGSISSCVSHPWPIYSFLRNSDHFLRVKIINLYTHKIVYLLIYCGQCDTKSIDAVTIHSRPVLTEWVQNSLRHFMFTRDFRGFYDLGVDWNWNNYPQFTQSKTSESLARC